MEFTERVAQYAKLDAEIKEKTKVLNTEKEEIKTYMIDNKVDEEEADGYKVQCVKSTRTTTDEQKMMEIVKNFWHSTHGSEQCPYLKTVIVLDTDALETALYHNDFPKEVMEELNGCITSTPSYALKCSKIKNKKEEV